MEILKSDWELYKRKLPFWQEKHMEKINCEYIEILNGSEKASEKFWKLVKRISKDKKKSGVTVEMSKDMMLGTIVELLNDKVISFDDIEEFSDSFKDAAKFFM